MKQEVDDDDVLMEFGLIDDKTSTNSVKEIKNKAPKRKALVKVEEQEDDKPKRLKISKDFLEQYGPQLKYSFNLWKKNSHLLDRADIDNGATENPLQWSVESVCEFVTKITNSEETVEKFEEQKIDGAAFVNLCQNDLVSLMSIKLGTAIKIYNRILHLREEVMLKFLKI